MVWLSRMWKFSESVRNVFAINVVLRYMGYTKLCEGNVCFLIIYTEYNYDEMVLIYETFSNMSKHGCGQIILIERENMNIMMAGIGLSLQLHTIT